MGLIETEAWVLQNVNNEKTSLIRKVISFDDLSDNEVLAKPIYGCLEGNMVHSLNMNPENVFQKRNENEIILGNSGVVQIERVGMSVTNVEAGDLCLYFCNGASDEFGYPLNITAYDKPKSLGVFSKKIKLNEKEVIKIPGKSRYTLQQWAAFSSKYITAWSNWNVAYQCWKAQMKNIHPEETFVFGWGGGVAFAELSLAKKFGCKCYMMTSKPERMKLLKELGIVGVNRTEFEQTKNESAFLNYVLEETGGRGVSIFVDNIGHSVYKLTLKVIGRQGVITTCGWKTGGMLPILRPHECQQRHIHVFTHFATFEEGIEAVNFAETNDWCAPEQEYIFEWENLPEVLSEYSTGKITNYFPVYKVN